MTTPNDATGGEAEQLEPYAAGIVGPVFDEYLRMPYATQVALEQAINALEWNPLPNDVRVLRGGSILAVVRVGLVIVYCKDDEKHALDVLALLPIEG